MADDRDTASVRHKYNRNARWFDSMDRMISDEWRRALLAQATGIVQRMIFPNGAFDTVLATCVFCTVPDPVQGLREAKRVCKPGGRVLLLEHVRIDRPVIGRLMDLLDPVVAGLIGTHINRRTVENAAKAGLQIERVDALKGDLIKLITARA